MSSKSVFGQEPKIGCSSFQSIPANILTKLQSEEDLLRVLGEVSKEEADLLKLETKMALKETTRITIMTMPCSNLDFDSEVDVVSDPENELPKKRSLAQSAKFRQKTIRRCREE